MIALQALAVLAWCAASVLAGDANDPALSQKTTYDGGYKRLCDAVSDVAKLTGAKLRCGKNTRDWQVRDIPVVVCVKDMALGNVLRALADATHVRLLQEKSQRIAGEQVFSYRLCRTARDQQALDRSFRARDEAVGELRKWAWDALASAASMPDEAFASVPKTTPGLSHDC